MPEILFYAGNGLDRAAELRRDDAWTMRRLRRKDTRFVPVWRNRNLIRSGANPRPAIVNGARAATLVDISGDVVLLGLEGRVAYFATDISELELDDLKFLQRRAEFIDLRQCGPTMDRGEAALMAYARGMMYWHRHHRYCGRCGSPTENRHGGHVRVCSNPGCEHPHFPRTDPAVIMLVTRDGRGGPACLLARQSAWPKGTYSTLAGFVEPGESLEEAVAREVYEEAGIRVTDVQYQNSQPWPFPASIMLGYRARATTTRIRFDTEELEDARWFTLDEVLRLEDVGLNMPRTDSIARWLVESWIAEFE